MRPHHRLLAKTGLCYLFLSVGLAGCRDTAQKESVPPRRPNIIYILADDLGYGDLGCYGQQRFKTPHIDGLARDGMKFTRHYAGAPVCAPSRSALLTGQHTGHTFIRGNREIQPEGQYPLQARGHTLAGHLKENGYVTGAFGKWGLGYPGSEGVPNRQGFDEFFGYNCQRIAHNYYPYHLWHNDRKIRLVNNGGTQTETYGPEIIHQKALSFLEAHKDTTFFLYYPSLIPHAELVAPERYMAALEGRFAPETPYEGIDSGELYKNGGYGSQQQPRAAFAAMVALLDEQVGDLRRKLEELGIAAHTLIIFTSDNGPHLEGGADPDYFDSNGPLRGYKRDLYEGGIRVPMIACWPGKVAPNSHSDHISAFWDVAPTLLDLAGVPAPEKMDGISFLPELLGQPQPSHEYLYWEFHEEGGKQAVRMGPWKGVRLGADQDPGAPLELYHLPTDPGEETNVAGNHPEILRQIAAIMNKAHTPSAAFPFAHEDPAPVE